MLDVGAGTGCLVPSLLRVARSEREKLKVSSSSSSSSSDAASLALLPMDYLAVDVSAGMLQALERIHGSSSNSEEEEEKDAENDGDKSNSLLGNLPKIRTWLGDVESVPQFQAPFDVCLFNAVFGNVFDQRSSLLSAALLMRPGTGRIVVAHPMGRRWHERLRAADAGIVPHALPGDVQKWAELLRGLPLELVGVEEEGEVLLEGGEEGAKAEEQGGDYGGNESSSSTSTTTSSPSYARRRLLIDDEDCYIAVLRVPPAWRLPASLYGSLPPPAAAASNPSSSAISSSSFSSSSSSPSGGDNNNNDNSEGKPRLPLIPQLLPRLPWQQQQQQQQQQDDGEKAGEQQDESSPPFPAPLPPLLLGGKVVKGFGRGSSKMGIPTANLDPVPLEEALAGVPDGVYFGWARLLPENGKGGEEEEAGGEEAENETKPPKNLDHRPHKCVLNVGRRPTFDAEKKGVGELSVEVHVLHKFENSEGKEKEEKEELLNFCGRELRVAATGFVRPEMRFPGIAALVSRIRSDVATAAVALEEREHAWAKGHGYLWGKEEGEGRE